MRKSRSGHVFYDDELGMLAGAVVARIGRNRFDRDQLEDLYQNAYLAGLKAQHAALRSQRRTSSHFLFFAMREAVYRLLRRANRGAFRESDLQCA